MDKCNCCGLNARWICECGFLFCANHYNEHPSSHNKKQISNDLTRDEKENLNKKIVKNIDKYRKLAEKILNYKREFKRRIKVACKKTLEKIENKKAKLSALLIKRKFDELEQAKARKILQKTFKYKILYKEGSKWIEKFFDQRFWENKIQNNSDVPFSSADNIEVSNPEPNFSIPDNSTQVPRMIYICDDLQCPDNFPQKRPNENSLHQKKLTEIYTVKTPKVSESDDQNSYEDRLYQNMHTRNVEPSFERYFCQYYQENLLTSEKIEDSSNSIQIKKEPT
ncbi:hypothetical protein SteCoe_25322 [Stentor coeruleus]|uniref:Uncharacterized protein n=1 Tax=Stentor coeruleus TaxID=5963 RepID=A0A1R2BFG0_9CILI|nr:hypothetical protein SteCoe_25322 [Stentor coeruleus]